MPNNKSTDQQDEVLKAIASHQRASTVLDQRESAIVEEVVGHSEYDLEAAVNETPPSSAAAANPTATRASAMRSSRGRAGANTSTMDDDDALAGPEESLFLQKVVQARGGGYSDSSGPAPEATSAPGAVCVVPCGNGTPVLSPSILDNDIESKALSFESAAPNNSFRANSGEMQPGAYAHAPGGEPPARQESTTDPLSFTSANDDDDNNSSFNDISVATPEEFYMLTSLRSILLMRNQGLETDFSYPEIFQDGPNKMDQLEALGFVYNAHNRGGLPTEIGRLTNLAVILMSASNQDPQPLPTEIGLLTKLTYLAAGRNVSDDMLVHVVVPISCYRITLWYKSLVLEEKLCLTHNYLLLYSITFNQIAIYRTNTNRTWSPSFHSGANDDQFQCMFFFAPAVLSSVCR